GANERRSHSPRSPVEPPYPAPSSTRTREPARWCTTPTPEATDLAIHHHEQHVARGEASWRERALNAENALKVAHSEICQQRNATAELLGRIRDLEQDLPADGVQRVITENTTLKHQVRQLGQDNQRLEDRLRGARDNARFLDKRLADLEA